MSRWALLSAVGYFAYRMARHFLRRVKPPEKTLHLGPGTDMAQCPRCYTYVPVDTTLRASVDGITMHFCSPECLEAYRRDQQNVDARAINPGDNPEVQ